MMKSNQGSTTFNPDSVKELAAAVLKLAVDDKEIDSPMLVFWCDVLDLEFDSFKKRAAKRV